MVSHLFFIPPFDEYVSCIIYDRRMVAVTRHPIHCILPYILQARGVSFVRPYIYRDISFCQTYVIPFLPKNVHAVYCLLEDLGCCVGGNCVLVGEARVHLIDMNILYILGKIHFDITMSRNDLSDECYPIVHKKII